MRLSNEQCLPLILRGQAGDTKAFDELIRLALPHFKSILAKRFHLRGDEIDECGPIMLWQAAKRYDLTKGMTYLNYACQWIRSVIRVYVHETRSSVVTIPYGVAQAIRRYERGASLDSLPAIARELVERGFSSKEVAVCQLAHEPTTYEPTDSLTRVRELIELIDRIAAKSIACPKRRQAVCQALAHTDYATAGRKLGISRERARQLATILATRFALCLQKEAMSANDLDRP